MPIWHAGTLAQSGFCASGGDAMSSGGNISFTFGQIDYLSLSGSGGAISEGVQQPLEIFTVSVSPLRQQGYISLRSSQDGSDAILIMHDYPKVSYSLYGIQGSLLISEPVLSLKTRVPLSDYPRGVYLLTVRSGSMELKNFKLVKR